MYTPLQYAAQAEELKSKAKGLEVPVCNTLINVLRGAPKIDAALAELDRLGGDSGRTRATAKFRMAAKAIRARQEINAKTLEMR